MNEENKLKAIQEELTEEQLEGVSGGDNQTGKTNQSTGKVVVKELSISKFSDFSTP